jgi:hypothetical protein
MKKAFLPLTILFCCIFNVSAQIEIPPEEYEVYKAWIEQSVITPETKEILIGKFTADNDNDITFYFKRRGIGRELPQLQASTLNNYRLRNRQWLELKNNFGVSTVIKFVNMANWHPYLDETRDKSIITFSRVGFNNEKNQALVYIIPEGINITPIIFIFYQKKMENGRLKGTY